MLKRLSPLYTVTIILVAITIVYVLNPCTACYYIFVLALLIASFLMFIHLFLAWRRLAVTSRLSIFLSIVAWLGLFFGLIHTNGLTL